MWCTVQRPYSQESGSLVCEGSGVHGLYATSASSTRAPALWEGSSVTHEGRAGLFSDTYWDSSIYRQVGTKTYFISILWDEQKLFAFCSCYLNFPYGLRYYVGWCRATRAMYF